MNLAQLAQDLQVSNTSIREATARLERLGLVETVPYSGPKIKRLSAAQLQDTYDLRIALEKLAVRLVVQSEDPDVFKGMAAALQMQERACNGDDPRAVVDADRAFHDALVEASGNSVLLEMLPNLSDGTRLLLELNTPPSEGMDTDAALRGPQGHKRIFEALREGNAGVAVQELRRELTRGKERLVDQMTKREVTLSDDERELATTVEQKFNTNRRKHLIHMKRGKQKCEANNLVSTGRTSRSSVLGPGRLVGGWACCPISRSSIPSTPPWTAALPSSTLLKVTGQASPYWVKH